MNGMNSSRNNYYESWVNREDNVCGPSIQNARSCSHKYTVMLANLQCLLRFAYLYGGTAMCSSHVRTQIRVSIHLTTTTTTFEIEQFGAQKIPTDRAFRLRWGLVRVGKGKCEWRTTDKQCSLIVISHLQSKTFHINQSKSAGTCRLECIPFQVYCMHCDGRRYWGLFLLVYIWSLFWLSVHVH